MIDFDPILIQDWLKRSVCRYPQKNAFIAGNKTLTYQELDKQSSILAGNLLEAGIQFQDRVVIFLDNSIESVISLYAVLKTGGIFVILNPSLRPTKLAYILFNSQARFLISAASKIRIIREAVSALADPPQSLWVNYNSTIQKEFPDALDWTKLMEQSDNKIDQSICPRMIDQDLATLIYTSGSTGEPKGVMSTHHAMISAARSIIQYIQNEPDDIILNVLPLSFDYGLYQVVMSVMFGGTIVLEKSFTYIHQVLQQIAQHRITGFPIVPTIVAMLLNLQDLSSYDFSSLRYITNTGAALPPEHIKRFRTLFPDIRIVSMFGLTECKRVGYLPPEQIDIRPDSVGKAMPNCRTQIVDEEGNPVGPNEIGELIIEGSNVMPGYWKDPELTARAYRSGPLPHQRFLYSGDYFKQDEKGYLYFLGRKDDMIKTRGERVSPKEIENILSQMPGIAEAAVIGIPDKILGQVPKAFIVAVQADTVTRQDVLKYATQSMENFMVPKEIEFISALPRTPNGKIDKKSLKNQ